MIVVKVELWSARTRKVTSLGAAVIANDGTMHTAERGNFDISVAHKGAVVGKDDYMAVRSALSRPLRRGRVENYPKASYNVWRLVIRALKSAFPEER